LAAPPSSTTTATSTVFGFSRRAERAIDAGDSAEIVRWFRQRLTEWHPRWVADATGVLANELLAAEAQSILEHGPASGVANGIKGRRKRVWKAAIGDIVLRVPTLRVGRYRAAWLHLRKAQLRSEEALVDAVAQACLFGPSTPLVDSLIASLDIKAIPQSAVAAVTQKLEEKVASFRDRPLSAGPYRLVWIERLARSGADPGAAGNSVTALAWGTNGAGKNEVLAVDILKADDRSSWTELVSRLMARGLAGTRLVTSSRYPGLRTAVTQKMPGATWLLNRSGVMGEVLAEVPKPAQQLVGILIDSIYEQPSASAVRAQHVRVVDQLRDRYPEAAALVREAGPDMLAFTSLHKEDWPEIWSNCLPSSFDGRDRISIREQHSNYFLVALDGAEPAPVDVTPRAMPVSAASAPQGRAGVLAPPVHPRSRVETVRRAGLGPRFRELGIVRLANAIARRANLTDDRSAAAPTIRVPGWIGAVGVVVVLAVALAAHAINMFNFPRYELDEGTYVSSAWAVLNNQITAYPYGYGHPPLGWIQIALWTQLTGGFFTFGNALNSGRVLMLLYAVGSSALVYLIGQRMSGRRTIGLLAVTLFSFSPLGLVYQRQVYLDNISTFWLLLSLYMIISSRSRLSYIVGAGLSFAFAVLSKETIVVLVPVMVFALWLNTSRYQRTFGVITFTYAVLGLGSSVVLLALLRGELFPYAWHLPWDHHPHLSLLDTLAAQVQRSQSEGSLADSWASWTQGDSLLILAGIAATFFNLLVGLWKRNQLIIGLISASYWLFLLRGGVVLPFYIIVILPLAALNVAMAADTLLGLTRGVARLELSATVLVLCIAAGVMVNDLGNADVILTEHPTSAQTQAMVWIRDHVSPEKVVVVNSYLYLDLRQPGGEGVGSGATYPDAQVYWNVAYDPELHDGLLQGNWDRIDYIVADSEMLHDIDTAGGPMALIKTALSHSVLRAEFKAEDNEALTTGVKLSDVQIVISIYEVIHKGQLATNITGSQPGYPLAAAA